MNGAKLPPQTLWEVVHEKFGSFSPEVVLDTNREPMFDRPNAREAPFCQVIVHGKRDDGKTVLGMIAQERPHADWPGDENFAQLNMPVTFLTCPMGFREQVRGKLESGMAGARREAEEEVTGDVVKVLSEWVHPTGHNPSPSFTPTWGAATALEIDLASVVKPDANPHEPIAGQYWLTIREYQEALAEGTFGLGDDRVAYLCGDFSTGPIAMFLAAHPEIAKEGFE